MIPWRKLKKWYIPFNKKGMYIPHPNRSNQFSICVQCIRAETGGASPANKKGVNR